MSRSSKLFLAVLLFLVLVWILFYDLCSKLLLGGMLAFLLRPLTDRLTRIKGIRRNAASFLTLLLLMMGVAAVMALLLPPLIRELGALDAKWEQCYAQLTLWKDKLTALLARFHISLPQNRLLDVESILQAITAFAATLLQSISDGAAGVGFILIACFYLLGESDARYQDLLAKLPPKILPYAQEICSKTGKMLKSYLIGRIALAAFVGAFCGIGFWICGLKHPWSYALLLFFFDFIPYFGPFVGGLFPVAAAMGEGGVFYALAVLGIILAAQQLEESVIGVHIEANAVGVHPLAGIFCVLCCYRLFGVTGLFLAMPLAGLLKILYQTFENGKVGKIILQHEQEDTGKSAVKKV